MNAELEIRLLSQRRIEEVDLHFLVLETILCGDTIVIPERTIAICRSRKQAKAILSQMEAGEWMATTV